MTLVVMRDAWWSLGSFVKHPAASSLQATSGPLAQSMERTYTTES